jgi:hypothetical protein
MHRIDAFPSRLEERKHIFWRDIWLDIVDRGQHIASVIAHEFKHSLDFLTNLVRRTLGEKVLTVNPSPKRDAISEFPLEPAWFHVFCRHLNGVQGIDSYINEIVDVQIYGTATVVERLCFGLAVNDV